ncbi:MAG: response regulator [Synechococcus sp.]
MPKPAIICVDDEAIVLSSLLRQLEECFGDDYIYETAENAEEALELMEEIADDGTSILIVVSDWLMPGKKGDELLIEAHRKYPSTIKVLLTGQADDDAVNNARQHANLHACLRKPWSNAELTNCIKTALANLN